MLIFVFRTLNVGIRYLSEFRIPNLCSFFRGNAWKSKKTSMYRVIHKKVSHETEDKMQEKMDKLQKVPAPCELMFTKRLFWMTPYKIRSSGFVIRYLFSNHGNYLLFVSEYQFYYSSTSNHDRNHVSKAVLPLT